MSFWDEHRHEWFKPLECDACGAVFGWVYELDLNGSLFVCHACRTQAMPVDEKNVDQWASEQNPEPGSCGPTCGTVTAKPYSEMTEAELIDAGSTMLVEAFINSLNSDKTVTVTTKAFWKGFRINKGP